MKKNPITADSKAREVKKIARNLYNVGIRAKDLEDDYYRQRMNYLYGVSEADWDAVKECLGWWFSDFERSGSV